MTPYDRLSAVLDDPGNRHGPNRACVPVSTAGGRTRYVWLDRAPYPGPITVTLFDHRIAVVCAPDSTGDVRVSTAGYFTPTTRDALAYVVGGQYGWQGVTMSYPGSRGGPSTDPDTCTIYRGGRSYVLTDRPGEVPEWVTIPGEVFA